MRSGGGEAVKPTRIVEKPHIVRGSGRGPSHLMLIVCDNEREYTSKELALAVGFKSAHGFLQRLAKYGWRHPDILKPPAKKGTIFFAPGNEAEEAYSRLGRRERKENLKKLKVGSWEARML